jgi:hypothetical protein
MAFRDGLKNRRRRYVMPTTRCICTEPRIFVNNAFDDQGREKGPVMGPKQTVKHFVADETDT